MGRNPTQSLQGLSMSLKWALQTVVIKVSKWHFRLKWQSCSVLTVLHIPMVELEMVAGISRSQCAITKEVFEYKVGSQRFQTWSLEIQLKRGVEVEVSTFLTASHLQMLKVYFNVTAWCQDLMAQEIRGRISPHIKATSIVPEREKSQEGPLFHCTWGGRSCGIENKYSSSWVSAGMEEQSFLSKRARGSWYCLQTPSVSTKKPYEWSLSINNLSFLCSNSNLCEPS